MTEREKVSLNGQNQRPSWVLSPTGKQFTAESQIMDIHIGVRRIVCFSMPEPFPQTEDVMILTARITRRQTFPCMHFVNMTLRILQVLFKTDNALLNHELYLVKDCIYEDQSFRYCKVGVKPGTSLKTGSVSQTCREVGMEAVCSGNQRCKYYTPECVVTPLSTKCYAPMYTLSSRVCSGRQPRECPALQGVFSHMSGLSGGECGVVGQTWCAKGNDITASSSRQYYAYCAERKGAIHSFILRLLIHLFQ